MKPIRLFALGLALGFGPCVLSAAADKIVMPTCGISAHRGASRHHPENTIPAFKEAIRLGVHQIEFDVKMTKDKHCILTHDSRVKRVTNGTGSIKNMTLAEVKQLETGTWRRGKFTGSGVKMPTLREAFDIMPMNIWLNVHIHHASEELITAVATEIVRQGRQHQAFMAVGSSDAATARKVDPKILICNMGGQGYSSRYVNATIEKGAQFIQLLNNVASPEDMAKLKKAGVRINYFGYDLRHPEKLKGRFDAGVDFALVDNVEGLMKAAEALGIKRWKPVYRKDNDKRND